MSENNNSVEKPTQAEADGAGWVYHNEDTGEEYAPNHPVRSGEVPDATRVRRSTAMEDHLYQEWSRLDADQAARSTTTEGVREAAEALLRCHDARGAVEHRKDLWEALAASLATPPATPAGFVLMPVEPSGEQLQAGLTSLSDSGVDDARVGDARRCYTAMLAAADLSSKD